MDPAERRLEALAHFDVEYFLVVGDDPGDRAALTARIGELICKSTQVRANVESLNMETGTYRVVLHGFLENHRPIREQDQRTRDREPSGDSNVVEGGSSSGGGFRKGS